jgi:hypothetical protein
MEIAGVSTQIPLEIKQECTNCPHLCKEQERLDKAEAEKQDISENAMEPNISAQARILAAEQLGELEKQEAQARTGADAFQDNCPGALSMSAQDTLGRMVTVHVCSSPLNEKLRHGLSDTELATIQRTPPVAEQ